MSSPIADGVMAATQRLVNQAMSGQWQEVPKTVEERRVLLDQLSAAATPQDQLWLSALKQAMAESDAVVASMTRAEPADDSLDATSAVVPRGAGEGMTSTESANPGSVDDLLGMIRGSR